MYPTDTTMGYLYAMAFDSGWTKVGLTIDWPKRRRSHTSTFRTRGGRGLLQAPWKSDVVPRTELEVIEKRLRAEAPVADCSDRTPRDRARLTLLAAIWRGKPSRALLPWAQSQVEGPNRNRPDST